MRYSTSNTRNLLTSGQITRLTVLGAHTDDFQWGWTPLKVSPFDIVSRLTCLVLSSCYVWKRFEMRCFQGNLWPVHNKAGEMLPLASPCLSASHCVKKHRNLWMYFCYVWYFVALLKFIIAFDFQFKWDSSNGPLTWRLHALLHVYWVCPANIYQSEKYIEQKLWKRMKCILCIIYSFKPCGSEVLNKGAF